MARLTAPRSPNAWYATGMTCEKKSCLRGKFTHPLGQEELTPFPPCRISATVAVSFINNEKTSFRNVGRRVWKSLHQGRIEFLGARGCRKARGE